MVQADAAETDGDAALALRLLESKPLGPDGKPLWRPWRIRALNQLATFEQVLPGWAYSRWILAQALQDLRALDMHQQALQAAARVRAGRPVRCGDDAIDAQCQVIDGDWVYRQAFLYEYGGLDWFLSHRVSGALVRRADRIREWADAPMGGYQLLGGDSASVMWRDVASDETFTVANNGCGALVLPGEFVIGRRAPIEGGSMFESVPLLVPPVVAQQVARTPASWLDTLAAQNDAGPPIRTGGHSFELLSDVPPTVWMYCLADDELATLAPGPTDPLRVAREVVSVAREALAARDLGFHDPESLDLWACLGAALLEPDVFLALIGGVVPADGEVLRQLSEALPDPACSVVRAIMESPRDAA